MAEIKEIRWATPEWVDFTDKDGSGLYSQIVEYVAMDAGIKVIREDVPWERALDMVRNSQADMTGGEPPSDLYYQSKTPIVKNVESVLVRRGLVTDWHGVDTLKELRGVSYLGYDVFIDGENLINLVSLMGVQDREAAITMVFQGRADYFIDNNGQMMEVYERLQGTFDPEEFQIFTLTESLLYMCFPKTERGREIRDLFDRGMKKMYDERREELRAMYRSIGAGFPDHQFD
ncbi:hypothetical protein FEV53_14690 [Palleronia caenipelagi]|uniref:Amino acid ABC transporter substrate-binding protein n=2 Tax=Palleronia caenipelagi TaxID=2489174 RepID=A0A547PPQ2_9RHOB|nr:hypothetical protein FEV53_14690 [Palleronia caenipelagi]